MAYRVVLVKPRRESRELLDGLTRDGGRFATLPVDARLVEALEAARPDLIVLPTALDAEGDGIAVLSELRAGGAGAELPVLVLGTRGRDEDALEALRLRADDFLGAPFDPRELAARMRAILRRRFESALDADEPVRAGGIELDPARRRCTVRGKPVELKPMEFVVLETLMRKAGRVLKRAYLLETVWRMSPTSDTRAVDVMISKIRKRLGARAGKRIQTLRGLGYMFLED